MAEYNHVFMGEPYDHKAFPVAMYDPILAELTYKLSNLDASEEEAAKLFPDASEFRKASKTFCRKAAGHYATEKKRSEITFEWLNKVFDNRCVEQVSVPIPPGKGPKATATKSTKATGAESSHSSKGSGRTYAKPDGAVASKTGSSSPPVGDEEQGEEKEEGKGILGGVQTTAGELTVLSILIEIKLRFGNAVLQSVKVSARHLLGLEVRHLVRLCDCTQSDSWLLLL